jgi:hypothetical protein
VKNSPAFEKSNCVVKKVADANRLYTPPALLRCGRAQGLPLGSRRKQQKRMLTLVFVLASVHSVHYMKVSNILY